MFFYGFGSKSVICAISVILLFLHNLLKITLIVFFVTPENIYLTMAMFLIYRAGSISIDLDMNDYELFWKI